MMAVVQSKITFSKSIVLCSYAGATYFLLGNLTSWTWFVLGLCLGVALLWADQRWFWQWYSAGEQPFVITRMFIFLLVLVPLAIFIITSSGSFIGQGLVLGMVLNYVVEAVVLYRHQSLFQTRFLAGTTLQLSESQRFWATLASVGFSVILSVVLLV